MEVIRHAELIVEWLLCTIEHTNSSLDNSQQCFTHYRLRQAYNNTLTSSIPCRDHSVHCTYTADDHCDSSGGLYSAAAGGGGCLGNSILQEVGQGTGLQGSQRKQRFT